MALHRLDSENYKNLQFDPNLWQGIDTGSLDEILSHMYPPITKVTSISENKAFNWFFGAIGIEGNGYVEIQYPYGETVENQCILKNVDFSTYPFISVIAVPKEGSRFKYWLNSFDKTVLSYNCNLLIEENSYSEITGFLAVFEDASNVGV